MSTDPSVVRLHMGVLLLMLATTTTPVAAVRAARNRAEREGIEISDEELMRAVQFVRSQAASIFSGNPPDTTPSNIILAQMGAFSPKQGGAR